MAKAGNASTKIADLLVKHDVDLLRVESTLRTRIRRMMKGLDNELIKNLNRVNPSAPSHINFKMKRLNTLMSISKDDIEKAYKTMRIETEKDLLKIAEVETIRVAETINRVIQVDIASPLLDRLTLRSLVNGSLIQGAPSKDWWADQSKALQKRFERTMRESITVNETIGDMVRRVRGTRVNGFADGIMKTTTQKAEALARTSAQSVAQNARFEMYKENDDVVKGMQWQATLDGRTTPICQALDNQAWDLEGEPVGTTSLPFLGPPPAHWNCRSTLIPLLKSWDELTSSKNRSLKKKLREGSVSKKTRASLDGQVSADLKYGDWLKQKNEKNPKFVERILGPTKYRLWTKGKLSFTDMVDQSHRPLTVGQLRAKVGEDAVRTAEKNLRSIPAQTTAERAAISASNRAAREASRREARERAAAFAKEDATAAKKVTKRKAVEKKAAEKKVIKKKAVEKKVTKKKAVEKKVTKKTKKLSVEELDRMDREFKREIDDTVKQLSREVDERIAKRTGTVQELKAVVNSKSSAVNRRSSASKAIQNNTEELSGKERKKFAADIKSRVEELESRFPGITRGAKFVDATEIRPDVIGATYSDTWDVTLRHKSLISKDLKNSIRKNTAWVGEEDLLEYTIRHELGHVVNLRNMAGVADHRTNWFRLKDFMARLKVNGYTPKRVAKEISQYAGSNVDETFAEIFAIYTRRGYVKGTLPKFMEEFLERTILDSGAAIL